MARKKSVNKIYFGQDVEDAIQEYNKETNLLYKQRIFSQKIYPALNKLTENVINTWKFWRYETTYADLKADIVSHLYERLHMIDPGQGKAYSYFTRCIYHYCIKKNQDLYKEQIRAADLIEVDEERDISAERYLETYRESLKDFIILWSDWCMNNLDALFKSKNDRKVAEAIITLFQNASDLELFNKKELYILIREHSRLDTQYITRVTQQLKELFNRMFQTYQKDGKIIY